MQENDNPFIELERRHSVPDIHRSLTSWLKSNGEAQRFFEQNPLFESSAATRPLSQHSTPTGSSTNTIFSANLVPSNVPTSETNILPLNIAATICNDHPSSQTSIRPARYLGGPNTTLFINRGPKQAPKPARRPPSRGETPVDPEWECTFCAERGFTVPFRRIQDVKKHLTKYHKGNVVWICPQEDCRLEFDRENRFKDHFKQDHSRDPADLPDARVELNPQLVFACGFETCRHIVEAKDERDSVQKEGLYHDHIVDHLRKNPKEKWSHVRRLKNLMHQEGLKPHWRDRKKGQGGRWEPQIHTTYVLRKIIETRRYRDPVRVVQLVEASGYPPLNNPESAFLPLPPGLAYPLEVGFSEDTSSDDVTDGPPDTPSAPAVYHSASPRANSLGHDESLVNFQFGPPYVSVSQDSETSVAQPYGNDQPLGDYTQLGPFMNPTRPEEDTFSSYQANPFPANHSAHHLSQYPSGPLESNRHDNMAVDPRLLTLYQNRVADLSTDLDMNYGPVHTEDHS